MRSVALALLIAALLVTQLTLLGAPANVLLVAPASVAIGCAAAVVLQNGVSWIAVGLGAASSLAFGWLASWSLPSAGFAMCLLWLAPRLWLARSRKDAALAAGAALAASTLGGLVLARYAADTLVLHVASCVFTGAGLAMAALAGRSDSPLLHRLRVGARYADGEARELLERAADWLQQREDPTLSPAAGPDRAGKRVALQMARAGDALLAGRELTGAQAEEHRDRLLARLRELATKLPSAGAKDPDAACQRA